MKSMGLLEKRKRSNPQDPPKESQNEQGLISTEEHHPGTPPGHPKDTRVQPPSHFKIVWFAFSFERTCSRPWRVLRCMGTDIHTLSTVVAGIERPDLVANDLPI
jgi:hypothetical protein